MLRLLFIILLFGSCQTIKNQNSDFEKPQTVFKGIVHLNEKGCPYSIEITNCYVSNLSYYIGKNVYPVDLDEKYRKEGLKVEFNLNVSKAPSPTDCQIDYVVSLENLSVVAN